MKLSDELPVDHRLATVYRVGAGLCGVILLVFGILGFTDQLSFSTRAALRWPGSPPTAC
ncbi:hypothetical protein SCYAM73S_08576 [Streptomyces cyaneofuscatus]